MLRRTLLIGSLFLPSIVRSEVIMPVKKPGLQRPPVWITLSNPRIVCVDFEAFPTDQKYTTRNAVFYYADEGGVQAFQMEARVDKRGNAEIWRRTGV